MSRKGFKQASHNKPNHYNHWGALSHYSTVLYDILRRRHLHQNELDILKEHDGIKKAWADVDYAYISFYLGDEYAEKVRMADKAQEELEKCLYEQQLDQSLDFQRNELLDKLILARKDYLLGISMASEEMDQLLIISRAFVYSYFDSQC